MSTDVVDTTIARQELERAVARLLGGIRDADAMQKACERMDAMREELRERVGTIEVAVDLIRDARNQ